MSSFARLGRGKIMTQTMNKLDLSKIDEALDEIDDEDEYRMAFSLAMKKYSTMSRLDAEVQIRRIQSLLQRKGFGFGVIGRVIRELDIHSNEQL
jgi:regulatory protein